MNLSRRQLLSIGCQLGASAWFARSGFGQAPSNGSPVLPAVDDPFAYVNPEFMPALESFRSRPRILRSQTPQH